MLFYELSVLRTKENDELSSQLEAKTKAFNELKTEVSSILSAVFGDFEVMCRINCSSNVRKKNTSLLSFTTMT